MNARLRDLFLPQKPLTGPAYLITGLLLFACKYFLDLALTWFGLGFSWWPTDYFLPRVGRIRPGIDVPVSAMLWLLALALPFIWIGVNLTLRRLRTLRWPISLVCLFFVPYINFVFFAGLGFSRELAAERVADTSKARLEKSLSNAALMVAFLTILCDAMIALATIGLKVYGWGLFVGIPFFSGFVPGFIFRPREEPPFRDCFGVTLLVQFFVAASLLAFAAEGVICITMAAPIFLAVGALGVRIGLMARAFGNFASSRRELGCAAFLAVPMIIAGEARARPQPTLFAVTSRIEVNAPPAKVWKSVVTFSELPPPTEWIFRAGLAYPMRAEIQGQGVGAVRHCIFSTGSFVEPIIEWNEPRRLRFTVVSNPPPMKELSFFEVNPPHLEGFMESEQGQFELRELPDGRTELVGTTWYRHGLWPETYWRLWSDYIIHTIHLRVLRHIKAEAEARPISTAVTGSPSNFR